MSQTILRHRPALRSAAVVGALALASVGVATSASASPPDRSDRTPHGREATHARENNPAERSRHGRAAVEIDILSINDFHGRIAPDRQVAGAAVLACAVEQFEAANPNTLFVAAGDNIGASTFTSAVALDQPTLDVLNAMDLDVSTFGNHEFDKGRDDVDHRVIPASEFPYVSANIYDSETGERAYDPYYIEKIKGVSIAFVGAITEDMPSLVSPAGIAGLEFHDMTTEVNAVAEQLTDGRGNNGEADVVVVLVHEGAGLDAEGAITPGSDFGDLVDNADDSISAIISGHTHEAYTFEQNGIQIIQTGSYGERLGHVQLTYDRRTGDVTATSELVDLVDDAGTPYCAGDPEIQAIVDEAVAEAEVLGSVEIGQISADLNRALQVDPKDPAGLVENRGGESTIGNLVADVQLWAAQRTTDAQLAFMNPGGIRTNLDYDEATQDGTVTYKEAAEVQPFANTLVVMTLTGEQIYQLLEEQWQPAGASRPFLKLGVSDGFFYTYDPDAAAGEHITEASLDGVPIDSAGTYRVVANSFLASGGDNFTTFAEGTARADTGQIDLQAMVDYMAAFDLVSPDYAQRAVGVSPSVTGASLVLELSSLTFSTNEPKPTEVVTAIDGAQVATGTIDATVDLSTGQFDEVGRATVTIANIASYDTDGDGLVTVDLVAGETTFSVDVTV